MDNSHIPASAVRIDRTKVLGKGSFGIVYAATYNSRSVAVKCLVGMDTVVARRAFENEARQWLSLNHDHIVSLLGISVFNDTEENVVGSVEATQDQMLVMERMSTSVYTAIYSHTVPPLEKRLRWVSQTASAFRYLHHECNPPVLHLDLKPDNILIDNDGKAQVADFGLARVQRLTTSYTANSIQTRRHGAYLYAPPESFEMRYRPTTKHDVYCFAMSMYEILGLQFPFFGEDITHAKDWVKRGERPEQPETAPIPEHCWELIVKCWDHTPALRPDFIQIMDSIQSWIPEEAQPQTVHSNHSDFWNQLQISTDDTIVATLPKTPKAASRLCNACYLSISGHGYVRAGEVFYHIDCFRCKDCNCDIIEKYFPHYPIPGDKKTLVAYCELHYFTLLNLICAKCGKALRGTHVNVEGKKFHLEHFCCQADGCDKTFREKDSYYLQNDKILCAAHYSRSAQNCRGCNVPVMKEFVAHKEKMNLKTTDDAATFQWHPNCSQLYRLWGAKLKIAPHSLRDGANDPAEFETQISGVLTNVFRVMTIFDDKFTAVLAEICKHYARKDLIELCKTSYVLVDCVGVIFKCLEHIAKQTAIKNQQEADTKFKGVSQITQELMVFFWLLINPPEVKSKAELERGAQHLHQTAKAILKHSLRQTFSVEISVQSDAFLAALLLQLVSVFDLSPPSSAVLKQALPPKDSEKCKSCSKSVDTECFKSLSDAHIWHSSRSCFTCSYCGLFLDAESSDGKAAACDEATGALYCGYHSQRVGGRLQAIKRVSQLDHALYCIHGAVGTLFSLVIIKEQ
ncbi:hypothetical protein CcCBS67573_g04293 [Chytriomyces confervae]|uniref:Protein kinase domain-containing protein n=1 Tax=Chytriomyces confervae TaxID=246404 RepID=A0A507FGI6_9FUNG|nr:hypothetical protein CcCBS67573_g04293 [Chytriomyces confervae]